MLRRRVGLPPRPSSRLLPARRPSAPPPVDPGLHTPSLRGRLTVVVLLLLTVLLAVLGVTTDLVLRGRLEAQLEQRILDRASLGMALADQVEPQALAQRLEGGGVSVWVQASDGASYTAGPPPVRPDGKPGPAGGPKARAGVLAPAATSGSPGSASGNPSVADEPVVRTGDLVEVSRDLGNGTRLTLSADAGEVERTVDQTRAALLAGALAVLLLAAAVVRPVVGRALRPLDQITALARSIGDGDRGRRLRPDRPHTELGTTAGAFDDMLDAVEGAERRALDSEGRLRDFLSDAAHELRTPIAGTQAAAEHVLRANPSRTEREQTLTALVRESRRAGRLVDDLLLMARIDQGLDLRPVTVDLRALVGSALEARRLSSPDATLRLHGSSPMVRADPDRVTQVVGNLLDNALRATHRTGTIVVTVDADPTRDLVIVQVDDDGPGVAPVDRERIFQRLVRLDAPSAGGRAGAGSESGVGLGLPIALGIARAHGGDLVCCSPGPAPQSGARFRLTLPGG